MIKQNSAVEQGSLLTVCAASAPPFIPAEGHYSPWSAYLFVWQKQWFCDLCDQFSWLLSPACVIYSLALRIPHHLRSTVKPNSQLDLIVCLSLIRSAWKGKQRDRETYFLSVAFLFLICQLLDNEALGISGREKPIQVLIWSSDSKRRWILPSSNSVLSNLKFLPESINFDILVSSTISKVIKIYPLVLGTILLLSQLRTLRWSMLGWKQQSREWRFGTHTSY